MIPVGIASPGTGALGDGSIIGIKGPGGTASADVEEQLRRSQRGTGPPCACPKDKDSSLVPLYRARTQHEPCVSGQAKLPTTTSPDQVG